MKRDIHADVGDNHKPHWFPEIEGIKERVLHRSLSTKKQNAKTTIWSISTMQKMMDILTPGVRNVLDRENTDPPKTSIYELIKDLFIYFQTLSTYMTRKIKKLITSVKQCPWEDACDPCTNKKKKKRRCIRPWHNDVCWVWHAIRRSLRFLDVDVIVRTWDIPTFPNPNRGGGDASKDLVRCVLP